MATPRTKAGLPLLVNCSLNELPERYRSVVDDESPLANPERFIPSGIKSTVWSALGLLCCVLILPLISVGLFHESTTANRIFQILMLVAFSTGAYVSWRRFRHAINQRRALSRNLWKNGLHALPHAILLYDKLICTVLPRHRVIRMGYWSSGRSSKQSRKTIMVYRDEQDEEAAVHLPFVKAPRSNTTTKIEDSPCYYALNEWIKSGNFLRHDARAPFRPQVALRQWMPTVIVGHITFNAFAAIAIVLSLLVGLALGSTASATVAVLLGGPMFLIFPVLMGLVQKRFRNSADNTPGWGYLILLGFAAMVMIIAGFFKSSEWVRLQNSELIEGLSPQEIHRYKDQSVFLEINDTRVLSSPTGFYHTRKRNGESYSYDSYYVAPLVSRDRAKTANTGLEKGLYCLWLGFHTNDSSFFSLSQKQLLTSRFNYFMEASWLDRDRYLKAVTQALKKMNSTCEAIVLEGIESPAAAKREALKELILLVFIVNLVPLLLMIGYVIYELDRPWHPGMNKEGSNI